MVELLQNSLDYWNRFSGIIQKTERKAFKDYTQWQMMPLEHARSMLINLVFSTNSRYLSMYTPNMLVLLNLFLILYPNFKKTILEHLERGI